jgi:hypothetical protein
MVSNKSTVAGNLVVRFETNIETSTILVVGDLGERLKRRAVMAPDIKDSMECSTEK